MRSAVTAWIMLLFFEVVDLPCPSVVCSWSLLPIRLDWIIQHPFEWACVWRHHRVGSIREKLVRQIPINSNVHKRKKRVHLYSWMTWGEDTRDRWQRKSVESPRHRAKEGIWVRLKSVESWLDGYNDDNNWDERRQQDSGHLLRWTSRWLLIKFWS